MLIEEEPNISKNTYNTLKKTNDTEINPSFFKNGDNDFYNFLLTKTRVISFYKAKENLKYLKTRKFKDEKYKVTINNSIFFNFLGNNSLLDIINGNRNAVDNNNVLILSAKETNLCFNNNFKSIEIIFEIKHDDGFSSLHKHVIPFIVSSRLTSRYIEKDLIRLEKNSLINNYFSLPNSIDCHSNYFNNITNYTKDERIIKQIEKTEAFNNLSKYGRLKKEFTDYFDYFEDLFNVFSIPKIEFIITKIKRKEKTDKLEGKSKQEKSSKNKTEEAKENSNKESNDIDNNSDNKDDKKENEDEDIKNKKYDVIEEPINLIEFDIFYDDYYNIFELKYYKKRIYKKLELHHQIKNLYLTSSNKSDSINKQKEYIRLFIEFIDYFDKEVLSNLNSSLDKSGLFPITTISVPFKYKDFIDSYLTMIQESIPTIRFFFMNETVSAKYHTLNYKIIHNSLEHSNLIEDHNSVIYLIKVILKKLIKSKNNCIDLHLKEFYEKKINCCGNDNILNAQFFYKENNIYNKEASELIKSILYKFFGFIKVRVVVSKEELVNSVFYHLIKNNSNDIKNIEEQDIRDKICNLNTKKDTDCSFPYFHYSKADEQEDNVRNYFLYKNKDRLDQAAIYENLFDIKMKEIIEVYNNDNKYIKLVNDLKDVVNDFKLKTKGKINNGEKSINKTLNNKLEDIKFNMFVLEENSYLIIRQVIDLLLSNKNDNNGMKYHNLLIQHQLLKEKVNSNIEHYFNSCNYYIIIKSKSKQTFIEEIKKLNYDIESSEEDYYNKLTSEDDKRSFVFTEFCYLIETINTSSIDLMSISSNFSLKQKINNEIKYNDVIKDESFLEVNFKIIKCSVINHDLVLNFLQKYSAITDKDI